MLPGYEEICEIDCTCGCGDACKTTAKIFKRKKNDYMFHGEKFAMEIRNDGKMEAILYITPHDIKKLSDLMNPSKD